MVTRIDVDRQPARAKILGRIADHLTAHEADHPVRVAVDGITASGKTTMAAELAEAVRARGRPAIHLSMDGFHNPRARRHRRGRASAVGYYRDAYDFASFARSVLRPLGPDGDGRYRIRTHDLAADQPSDDPPRQAPDHAVLIVDGSFLQNAQLAPLWDEVVFLSVGFDAARERGVRRDAADLGGVDQARALYLNRYHAASGLYLAEVGPDTTATVLVGNDDPACPVLNRIGGPAGATAPLFSYGTLQQEGVQRATFGRILPGTPDRLPAHRLDWVTITDPEVVAASGSNCHPIVRPTRDERDSVAGTVLTLSTAELAAADLYEVDDYRRVRLRLSSGRSSWAYLATT